MTSWKTSPANSPPAPSYDSYVASNNNRAQNAWQTGPPNFPQSSSFSSGSAILAGRERQSQGVEKVCLSADVFFVCMTHALTTEKDEICGLLLGQPSDDGRRIDITACFPLPRGTHRQKDRVEITPLQMAMGVEHADALEKSHHMNVRVVGWYHSHPRLMPIPSSVDVRSQEACEQQDPTFVGLIFTPFNTASKQAPLTQQLQLLAFKSDRSSNLGFRQLPIQVVDKGGRSKSGLGGLSRWALDTLIELLTVLQSEEEELMANCASDSRNPANFLANTAYSYRLARVMNEIGYPLIAALESRLDSSPPVDVRRTHSSRASETDPVQKILDSSPKSSATAAGGGGGHHSFETSSSRQLHPARIAGITNLPPAQSLPASYSQASGYQVNIAVDDTRKPSNSHKSSKHGSNGQQQQQPPPQYSSSRPPQYTAPKNATYYSSSPSYGTNV